MKTPNCRVLQVQDHPLFSNIDAICVAVGIAPKTVHRGYLRAAGAVLPSKSDIALWWPSETNKKWENSLSSDGRTFSSRPRTPPFSLAEATADAESGRLTAIFFKSRSSRDYRFVGVFKTNLDKSEETQRHVYELVSTELEF